MARNQGPGRRLPTAGLHTVPWEQRVSAQAFASMARRMRKEGPGRAAREQPRMLHRIAAQGLRLPTAGLHTVPWEQRVSARAFASMARRMRKEEHGRALPAQPIGLRWHQDKSQ